MKELKGVRFGKLVVIERGEDYIRPSDKKGRPKYICKCDCGNVKSILGSSLKNGITKSCGCNMGNNLIKHGFSKERLYYIWNNMKQRCKKDKYYKNISICKDWNEYVNFRNWAINNGYNNKLTIDRIDNTGNYEPNNCRWTTTKIQANNKRNTIYYTFNGETKSVHQWEEITGVKSSTINRRIKLGWDIERALFEIPIIGKNQHYHTKQSHQLKKKK